MKAKYEVTLPSYQAIADNLSKISRITSEAIGSNEINYALLKAKQDGYVTGYAKGFEAARLMLQKEYL